MATRWQIIITFNCYEIISLFDQIIVGAEYVDGEKKIMYRHIRQLGWETTFNNKWWRKDNITHHLMYTPHHRQQKLPVLVEE